MPYRRRWMEAVRGLDGASALDKKSGHLAYLAVLAAIQAYDAE